MRVGRYVSKCVLNAVFTFSKYDELVNNTRSFVTRGRDCRMDRLAVSEAGGFGRNDAFGVLEVLGSSLPGRC